MTFAGISEVTRAWSFADIKRRQVYTLNWTRRVGELDMFHRIVVHYSIESKVARWRA